MKERAVTIGLALGALLMCYWLFLPKPAAPDQLPPRPLSTATGPTGYQALWRWLAAQQLPVQSLQQRYDRLPGANSARGGTGNLLLTTLPHEIAMRTDEAEQLDAWVTRGNTLVVAAALDDTPPWALQSSSKLIKDTGRLTRLSFDTHEGQSKPGTVDAKKSFQAVVRAASFMPKTVVLEPRGAHPLMRGVRTVSVESPLPASRWQAVAMDSAGTLQIGQVVDDGAAAVWIRRQGEGQVISFAVAGLFDNRNIGSADNAQLLSNIIGWALKPGGAFIFDDSHQGLVGYYDAKAFYADPRLHRTLAWLVLLWLVFVLGVQRLRPAAENWRTPDLAAFVNSSGEFFAASLQPAVAGKRLIENFFNTVRRRLGVEQDGSPTWQWLSSQAAVSRDDIGELRRFQRQIRDSASFDLTRLQNLLAELRGKIT